MSRKITGKANLSISKFRVRKFYRSHTVQNSTARELPLIDALSLLLEWLCHAQDHNRGSDKGVARHYSHLTGWSYSYPETTGYIVGTILKAAPLFPAIDLRERAMAMIDWLVSIQLDSGGFTGSTIDRIQEYYVPVVFNTGQVLIGLAAGYIYFGEQYKKPMSKAASWLMSVQDEDGKWSKGESPVARRGLRAYDTHVAYGLLEAARATGISSYAESAIKNVRWALSQQIGNGWFENCCLSDPEAPLTHTLGYTIRGIWEAYEYSGDNEYLASTVKTADSLATVLNRHGYLPGRLTRKWHPAVRWQCLTGNSQIAIVFCRLYKRTGNPVYLTAVKTLIDSVKSTILISGPIELVGAVKGSEPIQGAYCSYQYPNWAAKFTADAFMELMEIE